MVTNMMTLMMRLNVTPTHAIEMGTSAKHKWVELRPRDSMILDAAYMRTMILSVMATFDGNFL